MKMRRLGGKTLPSPPPPPVPNTRMSHIPPVRPPPMALHVWGSKLITLRLIVLKCVLLQKEKKKLPFYLKSSNSTSNSVANVKINVILLTIPTRSINVVVLFFTISQLATSLNFTACLRIGILFFPNEICTRSFLIGRNFRTLLRKIKYIQATGELNHQRMKYSWNAFKHEVAQDFWLSFGAVKQGQFSVVK